jgi:cystathionine beta-synthase
MNIVVIMCDSASRYLSKIFNDDWMRENGFLGKEVDTGTVADLLSSKSSGPVLTASPETPVLDVVATMKRHGFSQLPVVDGDKVVGVISESDMLDHLLQEGASPKAPIAPLVTNNFAIVEPGNGLTLISQFFSQKKTVIVVDQGRLVGIVTKIDFIDYVSHAT